jgi:RNA polymerase sigma-70 factor, ECF subfamily
MLKKDLTLKTDEELMVLYQDGYIPAFEMLYSRHSNRIFGFLKNKLGSSKEAQDLSQDVFFKLHRSRHQYNSTLPFSPWLFSITRSVLFDFIKKENKEDATPSDALEDGIIESPNMDTPKIRSAENLVNALPSKQYQVVSMRVYDEATFEEIALKLSTSPDNARQLFSRGIKTLRQFWGKE